MNPAFTTKDSILTIKILLKDHKLILVTEYKDLFNELKELNITFYRLNFKYNV